MSTITVQAHQMLERVLSLEIVRVTERAAVSAARLRGRGNEKAADQAAVDAMRRELNKLPIDGTVVIGEGEMDEAPMLFIGEKVGNKNGPKVDIAVDPLEGTVLCAKNMPGSIATLAMADAGTLLHAPDCYMQKIAIGPGYPKGTIDLDAPADELHHLAIFFAGIGRIEIVLRHGFRQIVEVIGVRHRCTDQRCTLQLELVLIRRPRGSGSRGIAAGEAARSWLGVEHQHIGHLLIVGNHIEIADLRDRQRYHHDRRPRYRRYPRQHH